MDYLTTSTPTLALNNSCKVDSHFRYMLFTVSYSIIFIVGVIANGYVVWIFNRIYPTKSMSEIKIFMKNLITADLLFLMTLPLWIVYYYNNGNWIMPTFLCNMAGCCFFINTYCSVAFLCVITYNRFQAVTRPLETAHSAARKRGCYIAAGVWIPIVSSASYFLFATSTNEENLGTHNVTRCFEGYSSGDKPVAIINLLLIASFFIVFLIILVCTVVIIKTLLSQPAQMRQSVSAKHRALKMVCAVLAIFVVCFVPHHIIHGPWTLTVLQLWRVEDCDFRQQLNDAHQVTLCLMGTNCVLDPVIYCFLTKRFRRHLSEYIRSMTSSRKCSKQTTETGVEGMVPLNQNVVHLVNK